SETPAGLAGRGFVRTIPPPPAKRGDSRAAGERFLSPKTAEWIVEATSGTSRNKSREIGYANIGGIYCRLKSDALQDELPTSLGRFIKTVRNLLKMIANHGL